MDRTSQLNSKAYVTLGVRLIISLLMWVFVAGSCRFVIGVIGGGLESMKAGSFSEMIYSLVQGISVCLSGGMTQYVTLMCVLLSQIVLRVDVVFISNDFLLI